MKTRFVLMCALMFSFAAPAAAQKVFNGCGMSGDAKIDRVKLLNRDKNRYSLPGQDNIDTTITLEKILAPGDDEMRFSNSEAAEIVGYVYAVKLGGIETCNCHAKEDKYRDTHIELVLDPRHALPTQRVIVEVTPRIRNKLAANGEDWSTAGLKTKILHKWVRIRGWMLFDAEHIYNSNNTNENGDNIWRATAWEIHPVTSIELVNQQ